MASIFKNGNLWWLKTRHPLSGEVRRISLATPDESRAELICQRWEAWMGLFAPAFAHVEFPPALAEIAPCLPETFAPLGQGKAVATTETPAIGLLAPVSVIPAASNVEPPLVEVLAHYRRYYWAENERHNAQGKDSILKRAFGEGVVEAGRSLDGPLWVALKDIGVEPRLSFLKAAMVQAFIEALPGRKTEFASAATRRHYREVFIGLFEHAMRIGSFVPTNIRYPNPMAAGLPGYVEKNRVIVYLSEEEIKAQLVALESHPAVHAAVGTMIYGGLRRAEALWLETSAVAQGHLSVRNIADDEGKQETANSLKTGARPVTILPELRAIYDRYVPTVAGQRWLFPSPKGQRWDIDNFSSTLRAINQKADLKWSAMHFRHTYATRRAKAGVSVFILAREMGTSVQMIEKHYAGFFMPEALR